jgi:hypothetical protein
MTMDSDDNSSSNTQDDYGHDDPRDTSFLNSFQRDPSAMKNRVSAGFMNEPNQGKPGASTKQQPDDTFVAPPLPLPLPVKDSEPTFQPANKTNYQSYDVVDTTAAPKSQGYDVAPIQHTASIPQPIFHGGDNAPASTTEENQDFNQKPTPFENIDNNQIGNSNEINYLHDRTLAPQQPVSVPVVERQPVQQPNPPASFKPVATTVVPSAPKPVTAETAPPEIATNPRQQVVKQIPAQALPEPTPTDFSLSAAKPMVASLKSPEPSYGPVTAAQAAGATKQSRIKRPPKAKKEVTQKEQEYIPNTTLNKTDSQILLLVFAVFLAFLSGIGYFVPLLGIGIGLIGLFLIILLRHQSPTLGKIGFGVAIIGIAFSGFIYFRTSFKFNYEPYVSNQYNYVIYKPNNWKTTTSTTESSSITRFDSPEADDKNPLASIGVATLLNGPKINDSDSAKNSLFQRYARAAAVPYDDYEEIKREEIILDDLPALFINAQGSIDGRTDILEYYIIYNQRGNSYVLSFNRYSDKKDDFEKNFTQIRDSFDANADLENIGK